MRPRLGWLWGALALAGVAAVVSAQSLGELAAKEQARREKERQKNGGASKVITDADLRGSGRGTLSNAGSTEAPAADASPSPAPSDGARPAAATAPKEKTPDELRAEQETAWRQNVQQAQAEVTRLTAQLDRLQQSLNDVTTLTYGSGRAALMAQFETTRTDLAAARQKVVDLEEEGRRNSYRAGS
jgi:hypothetical protein